MPPPRSTPESIYSSPIIFLSMSNVTLQSIAIGIVANNIATTIRITCYLRVYLHIISVYSYMSAM